MNILKILMSILALLFGVFVFVFGGYDDSPGAQGIGLLIIVIGLIGIIKSRKKKSK